MNLIAQPDAAYILADAATTDGAGKVVAISSKVVMLPHLHAAIGWTGWFPRGQHGRRLAEIRAELTGVLDQAEMLPRLSKLVASQHCRNVEDNPALEAHGFSILVALWHLGRDEAQLWAIHSDVPDWLPKRYKPCEPVRLRQLVNTAGASATVPDFCGLDPADFGDSARFSPERDGARLLTAQRSLTDPVFGHHNVGGFGEMFRVNRHGTHREVLCRWPDRVGRPVNFAPVTPRARWRSVVQQIRAGMRTTVALQGLAAATMAISGRSVAW